MSIESVMPHSHLILCRPILVLPPISPSIRVFSCIVERGYLLCPVRSPGKTLLAFALLHSVLQGQICLLLWVSLDFLLLEVSGKDTQKKRWQEYTEKLYKKDLHNPDNHNGVITHLEPLT